MKSIGPYVLARASSGAGAAGPAPSGAARPLWATDRLTGIPVLLAPLAAPLAELPTLPGHPALLAPTDLLHVEGEGDFLVTELPLQAAPATDARLAARGVLQALDALHRRGEAHGQVSAGHLWSVDGLVRLTGAGVPGAGTPAGDLRDLARALDELGGLPAGLEVLRAAPETLSAGEALRRLSWGAPGAAGAQAAPGVGDLPPATGQRGQEAPTASAAGDLTARVFVMGPPGAPTPAPEAATDPAPAVLIASVPSVPVTTAADPGPASEPVPVAPAVVAPIVTAPSPTRVPDPPPGPPAPEGSGPGGAAAGRRAEHPVAGGQGEPAHDHPAGTEGLAAAVPPQVPADPAPPGSPSATGSAVGPSAAGPAPAPARREAGALARQRLRADAARTGRRAAALRVAAAAQGQGSSAPATPEVPEAELDALSPQERRRRTLAAAQVEAAQSQARPAAPPRPAQTQPLPATPAARRELRPMRLRWNEGAGTQAGGGGWQRRAPGASQGQAPGRSPLNWLTGPGRWPVAALLAVLVLGALWAWAAGRTPGREAVGSGTGAAGPACCSVRFEVSGAAPPSGVRLTLAQAPAGVRLDPGAALGTAPGTVRLPGEGTYRVRVVASGFTPETVSVTVPTRDPVRVELGR